MLYTNWNSANLIDNNVPFIFILNYLNVRNKGCDIIDNGTIISKRTTHLNVNVRHILCVRNYNLRQIWEETRQNVKQFNRSVEFRDSTPRSIKYVKFLFELILDNYI